MKDKKYYLSWKEKKNVDFVKKITKKPVPGRNWPAARNKKVPSNMNFQNGWENEKDDILSCFPWFFNILWSVTTSGLSTARKMKEARQDWAGTVVLLSVNKWPSSRYPTLSPLSPLGPYFPLMAYVTFPHIYVSYYLLNKDLFTQRRVCVGGGERVYCRYFC